ncbi:hypothetical protein [Kitasatospora sp. NPDC056181]|uniref:hypothetical protein n=1 Tax=Kitasatospora sp. NPDC056181 TaxID=3345737 RepID=UPI0035E2A953
MAHEPPATFPGRWVGGVSLVVGPLLLLAGVLLRVRYDFFYPSQLRAYEGHPTLIAASYSAFGAGCVLLSPGIVLLASRIARQRRELALWGGTLAVLGLSARTFHAGVDHLAFQLAAQEGAEAATRTVGQAYGAFHVFSTLNAAILGGWVLLALGAHWSGVLGPWRALALALTAVLPLGVLKGTSPGSLVAVAGLCLALVPLGVSVLRSGPLPARRVVVGRLLLVGAAGTAMFLLGQAG